MNRKHFYVLLAVVGAALFFCDVEDAAARGRLFGRRSGGGGGGTLSINPNTLPASYAPQATALQQGQCTGASCPRPVATQAVTTQAAPATVASPAVVVQAAPSPAPVSSVAAADAPVPSPQSPASAPDVSSPQIDAAANAFAVALAKKLGIEIKVASEPPSESLAALVDKLPTLRAEIVSPEGDVLHRAVIDYAAYTRDQMGTDRALE